MPDFNFLKFDKPIVKLFRQGKIAKLYKQIYSVADQIASYETKKYRKKKTRQIMLKGLQPSKASDQILAYRNRRTQYHIDQMFRFLKLYVEQSIKKKK